MKHHRVAHQRLELGDPMVVADDVVVAIDGIAGRISGKLVDEGGGVEKRVLHAGQERASAVLARLAIAKDVKEQAEDGVLGPLVPTGRQRVVAGLDGAGVEVRGDRLRERKESVVSVARHITPAHQA